MEQTDNSKGTGAVSGATSAVQRFIADVLTEKPERTFRLDDYGAMRTLLFDNVKNAVQKRFPLQNNRYSLSVEDLDYDDPEDIGVDEQKDLLLSGRSNERRLRGSWVLRDAGTGKVVSKGRRMTIMKVPRLSDRGTFIRNGKEFCIGSIMRMEPGVYCKKGPDELTAQFNIKQGTGGGFNMVMNPGTGVFRIRRGTTNAPAYTVLRDMGVTDEQMKEAWGEELYIANRDAGQGVKARAAADAIYK